ncbi:hypothetical protein ABID42_003468 [Arcicella rosea]|uniref:hypothetical protein n=1 Tax=Arcicella rosea TaxID=502909 RepID=UPI00345D9C45
MEVLQGGDWDAACGFALGVGTVAAFATSPIAPATWGFIGVGVAAFCGGAAAKRIYI